MEERITVTSSVTITKNEGTERVEGPKAMSRCNNLQSKK